MALPAARLPRSPTDRGAILETAYAQATRIAFGRWLGQIDQSEIEALVGAAVLRLLDGEAEVIDTPQTVKYLTTFVDWRAKDELRVQQRHRAAPLPTDEAQAPPRRSRRRWPIPTQRQRRRSTQPTFAISSPTSANGSPTRSID
jgi:hypothetical protein